MDCFDERAHDVACRAEHAQIVKQLVPHHEHCERLDVPDCHGAPFIYPNFKNVKKNDVLPGIPFTQEPSLQWRMFQA